jgi:septum formation protein
MIQNLPIVLASQSPRRRQLLAEAGIAFEAVSPHPSAEPEGAAPEPGETTAEFVQRLAFQKAMDVADRLPYPALVIGCDTVAEVDGIVLGKPADQGDARRILNLLNGRRHNVLSGLALVHSGNMVSRTGCAISQLDLHFPSDRELEEYLRSGEWQGKSGAFGYQDHHPWLTLVAGSADNVVGLPMELLDQMIRLSEFEWAQGSL